MPEVCAGFVPIFSYADLMATVAVVLSLGGASAFAASQLGKNVVRSRNLAPNAVKTADIAKNAVKRGKIAPGTIDASRLANGSPPGRRVLSFLCTPEDENKRIIGQSGVAIPSGGQALAASAT